MQVTLNDAEKLNYCTLLGEHLKQLRSIAGCTQEDLARVSGISKERISRMENGAITMRWAQFVNLFTVFTMKTSTKEYMVAKKIITPRLLQALQMKDSQVPPDVTVPISDSLLKDMETDFRIASSLRLGSEEK